MNQILVALEIGKLKQQGKGRNDQIGLQDRLQSQRKDLKNAHSMLSRNKRTKRSRFGDAKLGVRLC